MHRDFLVGSVNILRAGEIEMLIHLYAEVAEWLTRGP